MNEQQNALANYGQAAWTGQLLPVLTPRQKAAEEWHKAADRLDGARAALAQAQAEALAAEKAEQEAWGTLKHAAGRADVAVSYRHNDCAAPKGP